MPIGGMQNPYTANPPAVASTNFDLGRHPAWSRANCYTKAHACQAVTVVQTSVVSRDKSRLAREPNAMPEDNDVPPDMSWFTKFPPEDQVDLLKDPRQPLPELMTKRAHKVPGLWWSTPGPDRGVLLSTHAVDRLDAIKAQLDHWWEQALTAEQREYILNHRSDELDGDYAEAIRAANESHLGGRSALHA